MTQSFQPQPLLSTFILWLFISPSPNSYTCPAVSTDSFLPLIAQYNQNLLLPHYRSSPKHQLLNFSMTFSSSFLMLFNILFLPSPNGSTTFVAVVANFYSSQQKTDAEHKGCCFSVSASHCCLYQGERTSLEMQATFRRTNKRKLDWGE